MVNQVRIIGGKYRGRKLTFAPQPDLRPTLGRARETLFNWLREKVLDARVLDLFAGSGALGYEALSRGAQQVTLVDASSKAVAALRTSERLLDPPAGSVRIIAQPAQRFLSSKARPLRQPFDIVLLDPPFAEQSLLQPTLRQLAKEGWLKADSWIYLELPKRLEFDLDAMFEHLRLSVLRDKTAGDCRFVLLEQQPQE